MTYIERLEADYAEAERMINDWRLKQRHISTLIDAARLREKPEFPTEAQRRGIVEACRQISEGVQSKSHHGDPTNDTYDVVVDGTRGWMHVRHGAPFRHRGGGDKLWGFTDEDVEVILRNVSACGFVVITHWLSDGGISIVAQPKAKP